MRRQFIENCICTQACFCQHSWSLRPQLLRAKICPKNWIPCHLLLGTHSVRGHLRVSEKTKNVFKVHISCSARKLPIWTFLCWRSWWLPTDPDPASSLVLQQMSGVWSDHPVHVQMVLRSKLVYAVLVSVVSHVETCLMCCQPHSFMKYKHIILHNQKSFKSYCQRVLPCLDQTSRCQSLTPQIWKSRLNIA